MLMPVPRHWQRSAQIFLLPAQLPLAIETGLLPVIAPVFQRLVLDIEQFAGVTPVIATDDVAVVRFQLNADRDFGQDGFELTINDAGVLGQAADQSGLRCALQALRQLVRGTRGRLPCGVIRDHADHAIRGYYFDVTRGRVPQLNTLLELVEGLALLRYNQFQLYIEHAFQFQDVPELWADTDPLTAADIMAVQARCHELGIELVPSLSCFGHCYTLLRSHERGHLNEREVMTVDQPFSLYDRLIHDTLDPTNPESLALVRQLLEAYVPLHSSEWVNICCDETVDLGTGRNRSLAAEVGVGRLYIDFVKQLCAIVHELGKKPMLWGDILLEHPEYIAELPDDVCILHWDYEPELSRDITPIAESGRQWIGCPGLHTWKTFGCQLHRAVPNLHAVADLVQENNGSGMLITDWGDLGHVSVLAASRFGMAHGAQLAWGSYADRIAVNEAWGALAYGDADGCVGAVLEAISATELVWWYHFALEVDPSPDLPDNERDAVSGISERLIRHDSETMVDAIQGLRANRHQLEQVAAVASGKYADDVTELVLAAWGSELLHQAALVLMAQAGRYVLAGDDHAPNVVAANIRSFEATFNQRWHQQHRPSEYHRVQTILLGLAVRLDAIADDN